MNLLPVSVLSREGVDDGSAGSLVQLHHLECHHALPDLLLQVLILGVAELVEDLVVVSQAVRDGVLLRECVDHLLQEVVVVVVVVVEVGIAVLIVLVVARLLVGVAHQPLEHKVGLGLLHVVGASEEGVDESVG